MDFNLLALFDIKNLNGLLSIFIMLFLYKKRFLAYFITIKYQPITT